MKRLPLLAFGLAVRRWALLTILLGVALVGLMMSPFPPNLAKCYRLVLGGLWLARMSTVCLSNLGLFMSKLLFGRMFIRIDACLSLAWFSLGLFWVGVGWHLGFLCLYASVSACVCLAAAVPVGGWAARALSPIGFCSLAWPLCLGWPLGSLCPSARRCLVVFLGLFPSGALWVPVGCLGCCL